MPLTLRELCWMAEGGSRRQWSHTSCVLAMMANANRSKKSDPVYKPGDFDPHAEKQAASAAGDVSALRDFCKGLQTWQRPAQ